MAKRHLTAAAVAKLKAPASGQLDVFDAGYPGLCLRVGYGGSKAWCAFVRVGGRQRRIALGRYPAVTLGAARERWREVAAGGVPSNDSAPAVIAEWLKRDQAGNRGVGEVKRLFDRDVIPAWHGRKIGSITRHDCLTLIDAVADRGAVVMARRLHSHLHRFLRWCVGRGVIPINPLADTEKPGKETSRDHVLTDSALSKVWNAATKTGWPYGAIVQLLILTGARRGEIGKLQWNEIVGDEIRLPAERTKTGAPHNIPLTPHVGRVLAQVPRILNCPFVFSLNGKTPVYSWARDKARLDKSSGVTDWHIHDLRRTCATGLQKLGVSLQVVEAILGHTGGSRRGIVGVYQRHDYKDEKREALARWAKHILNL